MLFWKKIQKKITLKSKLFKKTTLKKEKKKWIEPSQLNQTLESKWNSTSQSHERQRIVLIKRNGGLDMEKISTLEGWMIAYDFKSKINFYPPLESCLMT